MDDLYSLANNCIWAFQGLHVVLTLITFHYNDVINITNRTVDSEHWKQSPDLNYPFFSAHFDVSQVTTSVFFCEITKTWNHMLVSRDVFSNGNEFQWNCVGLVSLVIHLNRIASLISLMVWSLLPFLALYIQSLLTIYQQNYSVHSFYCWWFRFNLKYNFKLKRKRKQIN